jgi:ABC-type polar amino acid transport system ATPase subunit
MKNVDMQIKDGKLVITVDLSKQFGPSTSGKSIIIASTEGNASIPGREEIKIGLNVYQKP